MLICSPAISYQIYFAFAITLTQQGNSNEPPFMGTVCDWKGRGVYFGRGGGGEEERGQLGGAPQALSKLSLQLHEAKG